MEGDTKVEEREEDAEGLGDDYKEGTSDIGELWAAVSFWLVLQGEEEGEGHVEEF